MHNRHGQSKLVQLYICSKLSQQEVESTRPKPKKRITRKHCPCRVISPSQERNSEA